MPIRPNTVRCLIDYGGYALTIVIVQTVGHADLFQDGNGKWWCVALSTRGGPDFKVYPMGRETVLTNATWEEGAWPMVHNPIRGVMNGWPLPETDQHLPGHGYVSRFGFLGTFPYSSDAVYSSTKATMMSNSAQAPSCRLISFTGVYLSKKTISFHQMVIAIL